MPLRPTTLVTALAILYFGPGLLFLYVASGAEPKAVLASADEPGERLHVRGTVYGPDGETPATGVTLYVYHTDAEGLYSETNDNTNPRLSATLQTDDQGRYAFETIRPAPYPGGGVAAHVHYRISGADLSEQRFELHFEGDPYLSATARERSEKQGKFGSVRPLNRGADGVWKCVFDLRLRR